MRLIIRYLDNIIIGAFIFVIILTAIGFALFVLAIPIVGVLTLLQIPIPELSLPDHIVQGVGLILVGFVSIALFYSFARAFLSDLTRH